MDGFSWVLLQMSGQLFRVLEIDLKISHQVLK